jgi:hypothetical protein
MTFFRLGLPLSSRPLKMYPAWWLYPVSLAEAPVWIVGFFRVSPLGLRVIQAAAPIGFGSLMRS